MPARCSPVGRRFPSPSGPAVPSRRRRPRGRHRERARLTAAEAAERVRDGRQPRDGPGAASRRSTPRCAARSAPRSTRSCAPPGAATAIVCPAFPAQGRVVLDRVCLVERRARGRDARSAVIPLFPGASPPAWWRSLRPQLDRALAWIPHRSAARRRANALAARLGRLAGTVDRRRRGDRRRTSTRSSRPRSTVAPRARCSAGAAGLARALAARLGPAGRTRAELPARPRWLRRGRQPAARPPAGKSARRARPGSPCSRRPSGAWPTRRRHRALAAQAARGARARALGSRRGHRRRDGGGAVGRARRRAHRPRRALRAPGLALGHLRVRGREPLPLLTKAGGFGAPDLFVSPARRRRVRMNQPGARRDDGRPRRRRARRSSRAPARSRAVRATCRPVVIGAAAAMREALGARRLAADPARGGARSRTAAGPRHARGASTSPTSTWPRCPAAR